MARNDEEEILLLEREASQLGYEVEERLLKLELGPGLAAPPRRFGEPNLSNQFHWIASHLMPERMSALTSVERKRVRQEISKRTKELSDVVKAKHIQHHLAFSCIDLHDECVRKRKRQKKSPYVCFLALFICLGSSMKGLLAAIARAGGHLPEIF